MLRKDCMTVKDHRAPEIPRAAKPLEIRPSCFVLQARLRRISTRFPQGFNAQAVDLAAKNAAKITPESPEKFVFRIALASYNVVKSTASHTLIPVQNPN